MQITKISLDTLKNIAQLTNVPLCICGGWAVYFTINELFKKQKNREYIGSQDIDIGFFLRSMMTKSELESTTLFKTLTILESEGFQPEGFRYRKDIVDTEPMINTHAIEKKSFTLYIDILVNAYPPSLYDLYPNSFFEVPLLEQVYSHPRYQVRLSSVSNNIFIPIREIIIAMKIQSLPARGNARHKKVKDLCDLYGLLWYSSRSVEELIKTTQQFVQRGSVEQLKKTIDSSLVNECEVLLGEPKGSVNTVLHAVYDLRI